MPTINFDPTGTEAGWSFGVDGGEPSETSMRTRAAVHWAVKVTSDETVRLATGAELDNLPGHVYITIGDVGPEGRARYSGGSPIRWGGLYYWQANDFSPENYNIELHVSERLFDRIQHSVERGQIPSLALSFGDGRIASMLDSGESEPIKFGWEPDGSGMEWDNKNHHYVEMFGYRLLFDSGLKASEEDPSVSDPGSLPVAKSDLEKVAHDLEAAHLVFAKLGGQIRSALWFITALLAIWIFVHY